MIYSKNDRLLSFLVNSHGYVVPQPNNNIIKISKTLHPYLIGKRNKRYFYDLEKSLYGIKATLEVIKNIVSAGGQVTFVDVPTGLEARFVYDSQINFIRCKRGALSKTGSCDLVILNKGDTESLVEAHRECLLLTVIGSSTMSHVAYPFNLNIHNPILSDWFLGLVYTTCVQGKRIFQAKRKTRQKKLLGRGQNIKSHAMRKTSHNFNYKNAT